MATAINVATLVRRGSDSISGRALVSLVENKSLVKKICADIDARADVARELEASTKAAAAALDEAKAQHEAAVTIGLAGIQAEVDAADEKAVADMEALVERSRAVGRREGTADERDRALDVREAAIKRGQQEFVALTERLKELSLETQED